MVPFGKVGIEKLGDATLGRTGGVEMKGRLPGGGEPEEGSAGASKVVSASASDMGIAFNIVAASESEGRCKSEESTPEGGVCRALPTSFVSPNPGLSGIPDACGRDSGESLGFFVSRDGSLRLSNRHLYIGPARQRKMMQQGHTPKWHCCRVCREQGTCWPGSRGFLEYIRGGNEGLGKLPRKSTGLVKGLPCLPRAASRA